MGQMAWRTGGAWSTKIVSTTVALVVIACVASAEQRYAVKRIENLPLADCEPVALNEQGHMMCACETYRVFFWSPQTGPVEIDKGDERGLHAGKLNNFDVALVLGQSWTPYLWRGGELVPLQSLIDPSSDWRLRWAKGINDAGQIVGVGNHGGFLLLPGEPYYVVIGLEELTGHAIDPSRIDNSGAIVGRALVNGAAGACLWTNNTFYNLGTLGGNDGTATDVNDLLQVVGWSKTEALERQGHAFLWQDGMMQDLGTLGGENSYAYHINHDGLILGGAEDLLAWGPPACIWEDGQVHRLVEYLPCGMNLEIGSYSQGLNEAGQIAVGLVEQGRFVPCLPTPLRAAIRDFEVFVRGGSTIELRIATDLLEGSQFGVVMDDRPCEFVTTDVRGRIRKRWLNQTGAHTIRVEGLDDLCATVECAPRPEGFVVSQLPALPLGQNARALAVDADGRAVGYSDGFDEGTSRAVMWEGGSVGELGTLGGRFSSAGDISGRGWIVGWSQIPTGGDRPCLWADGRIVNLDTLSIDGGEAYSVNDAGHIVGMFWESGEGFAFFWQDGEMSALPPIGHSTDCQARAINNKNEVVGRCDAQPLLWTPDGGMVELNTLGGRENAAFAINDLGEIAGYVEDAGGSRLERACVWNREGRLTRLPLLYGQSGRANDINRAGEMVGRESNEEGEYHAMLWRARSPIDLSASIPTLCPWNYLAEATGISDSGHIVGLGYLNGEPSPFLMTPAYPGNIKRLAVRCKGSDLVLSVKSWLPSRTTLTAAADTGPTDCMTTDESGRGKVRLTGAAGASRVCVLEYADLCEEVSCR